MGYDIKMTDKKSNTLEVKRFKAGGLHVLDEPNKRTSKAHMSITYNYAWFFYKFIDPKDGIRVIYNKTGKQAKTILQKAIKELCSDGMGNGESKAEQDYWIPTPSNVTIVLKALLKWCNQHPDGIFKGD